MSCRLHHSLKVGLKLSNEIIRSAQHISFDYSIGRKSCLVTDIITQGDKYCVVTAVATRYRIYLSTKEPSLLTSIF